VQANRIWVGGYQLPRKGLRIRHRPTYRIFAFSAQSVPIVLILKKTFWRNGSCAIPNPLPNALRSRSILPESFIRNWESRFGVVLQPYAGTPIEGWMPKDIQLSDPRTRKAIEELDTESDNYDVEKARQQLARATELWKLGKRAGEPKCGRQATGGTNIRAIFLME